MPFKKFNPRNLKLKPLEERVHDMDRNTFIYPDSPREPFENKDIPILAEKIKIANKNDKAVIFSCGAHVLKQGLGPFLVALMEHGFVNHIAMNGAGAIHDFELALIGATTESVARYIKTGEFGLWNETGRINDAVSKGYQEGIGFGEALGRMIEEEEFPYHDTSVFAAGIRLGIPVTVHIGIGYDIIHEHPNFDGAAAGGASYTDFLIFAETVSKLEGGVFLNVGTSVMGPEVYLKALSMARNVAHREGSQILNFTTAVFDLQELHDDVHTIPPKDDPCYYFRPYKTVLVRTVSDGGESYYIRGDHRATIPALYDLLSY